MTLPSWLTKGQNTNSPLRFFDLKFWLIDLKVPFIKVMATLSSMEKCPKLEFLADLFFITPGIFSLIPTTLKRLISGTSKCEWKVRNCYNADLTCIYIEQSTKYKYKSTKISTKIYIIIIIEVLINNNNNYYFLYFFILRRFSKIGKKLEL